MAPIVFLVTGTTSGIGAALVDQIVARGDKVIAAGRKAEERLSGLKSDNVAPLDLDVSDSPAEIQTQVKKAWNIFGHIDVLMNNAGISSPKCAEEAE
jgi:NAD(P)-dependent dehydrogenase (short-subunit alcohol dehydrogenase family)